MLQKQCLRGRDTGMLVNHSVQSMFGCSLHGHDLCVNRMSRVAVTMVMLFYTPSPVQHEAIVLRVMHMHCVLV